MHGRQAPHLRVVAANTISQKRSEIFELRGGAKMRRAAILLVFLTVLASAKSKRSYLFTNISDTEGTITRTAGTAPHLRVVAANTISVNSVTKRWLTNFENRTISSCFQRKPLGESAGLEGIHPSRTHGPAACSWPHKAFRHLLENVYDQHCW